MMSRVLLALALLSCAPPAGAQPDGPGFAIEIPPGWQTAKSRAPGTVLAVRQGRAGFSIMRFEETLGPQAMIARARADAKRLAGRGKKVSEVRKFRSPAGVLYCVAGFGRPGGETHFGYFSVEDRTYSFLARRMSYAVVTGMLDTLAPPAPPPAPAGGTGDIELLEGRLRFPRVPAWRFEEAQGDALIVSGGRWTFTLSASAISEMLGAKTGDVQTMAAAFLAQHETKLVEGRGCRAGDLLGDKLVNGWKILYKQYSCPDSSQGGVTVVGVLLPRQAPLVAWLGDYAAGRQFDSFRSWMADGKEPAEQAAAPQAQAPASAAPPQAEAAEGPTRFIFLPLLLGAAGAVALIILIAVVIIIIRRRRSS